MQAYDLLPTVIRQALQEGPQQWDTGAVLRYYRKLLKQNTEKQASVIVVRWLLEAHAREIKDGQPWREAQCLKEGKSIRRWKQADPSPHVLARATMQYSSKHNERSLNELCST